MVLSISEKVKEVETAVRDRAVGTNPKASVLSNTADIPTAHVSPPSQPLPFQ